MAVIVDYSEVVAETEGMGLVSLYHRSGAFGFGASAAVQHVGWLGPADSTVRAVDGLVTRQAGEPFAERLAEGLVCAARELQAARTWLLPMSHWAYELEFGGGEWMVELLGEIGVDANILRGRTDGSAIEFAADEMEGLSLASQTLLKRLTGSDFGVLMPGVRVVGTIHHHTQIWWSTDDSGMAAKLLEIRLD